jgi:ribokinase
LSGRPVTDRASALQALAALGSNHRSIVVTLGGGGLVVAPKNSEPVEIAALPVTVVSTHGAGDCFVGALAAGLARGVDLVSACRAANTAAAEFVSRG